MAFIITNDIIDEGEASGYYVGNPGKPTTCIHKFQLLDDDDILYFEGLSSNDSSFAPLDLFGNGYGCTDLKYYNPNTDKFESL